MTDKVTRIALVAALIAIGLLLLRPAATYPAEPQRSQPIMVVDNATLYVLDNDKIYVYYWNGPGVHKLMSQAGTLQLMQTLDAKIKH